MKTTESPEKKATYLSQITYLWFYRVLVYGWKSVLQFEDIYDLEDVNKSKPLLEKFNKHWKPNTADFSSDGDTKDIMSKGPSLMKAIMKTIGSAVLVATICRIFSLCFAFAGPFLLRLLLQYIDSSDDPTWKGFVLVICLFLSVQLETVCTNRYLYHLYNFGLRLRTIVTAAVYCKALKLSKASKNQTTVGEIVNLMSVDAQKLQEIPVYVYSLWTTSVTFIVCVGLVWQTLGIAVLAGVVLLVLLVPFNSLYIGNHVHISQAKQMKAKDVRIKTFSELLAGMKVLKLYAWEKIFQDKVNSHRELELKSIKMINFLNSVTGVIWYMSTYVVCLVIFVAYVLISEENILNADKIFFTISILNIMRFPLSVLSLAIGYLAQAIVSMKRIKRFFLLEETQEDVTVQDLRMDEAIRITVGTFSWGKDISPVLKDISLTIAKGELVAVIGEVGSGKSSLIAALLGETIKCKGSVKLSGSVAYVPQEAWILSKPLKDNILLDKPELNNRYQNVLENCTLNPDIKVLSHGDRTEIGEKGINLSGGQKQRVSLARAVYQDEDIYLLDDPLSAVDAHVGKKLFDNVIGPNGLLKKKTRILVTHNLTCLDQVDRFIVMENGRISESGTYQELVGKKGKFAEFLTIYLQEGEKQAEEDRDLGQLSQYLEDGKKSSEEHQEIFASLRRLSQAKIGSFNQTSVRSTEIDKSKIIERQQSEQKDQLVSREEEKEGNITLGVIWLYMKAGGALSMATVFIFNLLSMVAYVLGSFWLSSWATDTQHPMNGTQIQPNNTYFRLGVYGGYIAIQAIMIKIGTLGIAFGCYQASRSLHSRILHKIIRAPMKFFDTTPLGRIMNRCSKDMDSVDVNLPLVTRGWIYIVLPLLSALIVITYSTPVFLAAGIPIIILFIISQRLYIKSARQLHRINSVKQSPVFVHFDESIVGATSIRAYDKTKEFTEKCHVLIDDGQKAWYMVLISMRWLGVTMATLGNVVTFFASLFAVLQKDTLGSGLAGLSISYSLQVYWYLSLFVKWTSLLETYMVSLERIKEYTEISSEADWEKLDKKSPENWPQEGRVKLCKYSTKYRPTLDNVLKEVCFSTTSSEKIGIVGRTGAGKSSIALSLFRIIEATEGTITIDDIDISELGLHDLRSKLTVIPQDSVIFGGSLRNNLDPEEKFSDSEIWESLKLAHLKEFVFGLPEQLQYDCGESGGSLSMGQRQLVCLARALLRKTKILVLDEATSGIDLATDLLIQTTIRTAFKNCTVLTIAHRLNTIMDYDRILVLDKGSVSEFDAPHVLLQNEQSIFYSLAKSARLC